MALSTGEGFAVGNDPAGVGELVRRLQTAAPELVVLEASDYERVVWIALCEACEVASVHEPILRRKGFTPAAPPDMAKAVGATIQLRFSLAQTS